MIQLLIAEDEAIERNYLQSVIRENKLVDYIFLASNGEEAVQLCKKHAIDILILDIEMPLKNGLEALKEIREIERQESICFILSSYNTFLYAQESIRLRVKDFLLKPSSKKEILDKITQACNQIALERNKEQQLELMVNKMNLMFPMIEKQCALSILLMKEKDLVTKQLSIQNIKMKSGFCIVCSHIMCYEDLLTIKQKIEELGLACLCCDYENQTVIFVIAGYHLNKMEVLTIVDFFDSYVQDISYGKLVDNENKLYQSYLEATSESNKENTSKIQVLQDQESVVKRLIESYLKQDAVLLKKELDLLIHYILQLHDTKEQYTKECLRLLLDEIYEYNENALIHLNFDEIQMDEQGLTSIFYDLFEQLSEHNLENQNQQIKNIIQYIEQNYYKQIGLQDVSDYLHLTPSYTSRILNKQMNLSFTEIMNEYRIREAKKLIKSGVPLKEVAYRVGFRSQSYFTQIFKKIVGSSPREYSK